MGVGVCMCRCVYDTMSSGSVYYFRKYVMCLIFRKSVDGRTDERTSGRSGRAEEWMGVRADGRADKRTGERTCGHVI